MQGLLRKRLNVLISFSENFKMNIRLAAFGTSLVYCSVDVLVVITSSSAAGPDNEGLTI